MEGKVPSSFSFKAHHPILYWSFFISYSILSCCSLISVMSLPFLHAAHLRRKLPKPSRKSGSLPRRLWEQVKIDVKLKKFTWSRGIRCVPRRVLVRIAHKRNDDEDAEGELYSLVTVTEVPERFKGLRTKVIDDDE